MRQITPDCHNLQSCCIGLLFDGALCYSSVKALGRLLQAVHKGTGSGGFFWLVGAQLRFAVRLRLTTCAAGARWRTLPAATYPPSE